MKKKMKILAVVLILVMVSSLFAACSSNGGGGGGDSDASPAASPQGDAASPSQSPPPSSSPAPGLAAPDDDAGFDNVLTGELGMYDADYDYFANPRYRVHYIILNFSGLHQTFVNAFTAWATLANVEFTGHTEFGNDVDAYMTELPVIAQMHDGVVVDPDQQLYPRIKEILGELGIPWMGGMAMPQDLSQPGFPLIHPYVGFDQDEIGRLFPYHLTQMAQHQWPGVPLSEYGFITVDHSTVNALHMRALGALNGFNDATDPDLTAFVTEDRYFVADTSIGLWSDIEIARDVVSVILTQNPRIERWLVFALVDTQAQGAALALDDFGLADNSWVSAFGGDGARLMWDAGQSSAWRSAGASATTTFGEPIFFALYAFMRGYTTPEEIWPEWVNPADGGVYANRLIPFHWITSDNYRQVWAWGDLYGNSNLFPDYSREGLTRDSFSARVEIPANRTGRR